MFKEKKLRLCMEQINSFVFVRCQTNCGKGNFGGGEGQAFAGQLFRVVRSTKRLSKEKRREKGTLSSLIWLCWNFLNGSFSNDFEILRRYLSMYAICFILGANISESLLVIFYYAD